jgi:hypothetical protein
MPVSILELGPLNLKTDHGLRFVAARCPSALLGGIGLESPKNVLAD